MSYVCWATLYEGTTDAAYFDILIPRMMEEIILAGGTRHATIPPAPAIRFHRSTTERVAREACAARDAFHLLFIHADTGGRAMRAGLGERSDAYCAAMQALCEWPPARCITILPEHETEAWILADPEAVLAALGFNGSPAAIGLPANARDAERLVDPKAALEAAANAARGRRRRAHAAQLGPAIAARQSLVHLRQAKSFAAFEGRLCAALADIGCL